MSTEERIFKALADPEKQEALAALLENIHVVKDFVLLLSELKNTGLLDLMTGGLAAAKAVAGDLVTSRDFAETAAKLLEVASSISTAVSNPANISCLSKAVAGSDASKPVGIYGLIQALQDPDVQRGLGYLLSIVKNLGACLGAKQ
ncbi:MAG: DUF1641 domain-containing protein [Thermoproteus sp.]